MNNLLKNQGPLVIGFLLLIPGTDQAFATGLGGLIEQCRESVVANCHGNKECRDRGYKACDEAVLARSVKNAPVPAPKVDAPAEPTYEACLAPCSLKDGEYRCLHQCEILGKSEQASCKEGCAKREVAKCVKSCDGQQAKSAGSNPRVKSETKSKSLPPAKGDGSSSPLLYQETLRAD